MRTVTKSSLDKRRHACVHLLFIKLETERERSAPKVKTETRTSDGASGEGSPSVSGCSSCSGCSGDRERSQYEHLCDSITDLKFNSSKKEKRGRTSDLFPFASTWDRSFGLRLWFWVQLLRHGDCAGNILKL